MYLSKKERNLLRKSLVKLLDKNGNWKSDEQILHRVQSIGVLLSIQNNLTDKTDDNQSKINLTDYQFFRDKEFSDKEIADLYACTVSELHNSILQLNNLK